MYSIGPFWILHRMTRTIFRMCRLNQTQWSSRFGRMLFPIMSSPSDMNIRCPFGCLGNSIVSPLTNRSRCNFVHSSHMPHVPRPVPLISAPRRRKVFSLFFPLFLVKQKPPENLVVGGWKQSDELCCLFNIFTAPQPNKQLELFFRPHGRISRVSTPR